MPKPSFHAIKSAIPRPTIKGTLLSCRTRCGEILEDILVLQSHPARLLCAIRIGIAMDSIKHLQIRQKQRVTNFDIRPFCSVAIGYKRSFEAHLTTSIHGNPPDAVST